MFKQFLCVLGLIIPLAVATAQQPAKVADATAASGNPKVLLHTSEGDITVETLREQGSEVGRQFSAVRERRFLRRHDFPSRDSEIHGARRRLDQGSSAQACARADP